ncbi:MAG: T9SS type A sorting domain-containing protein, partial [Bacteroidota bacterium]
SQASVELKIDQTQKIKVQILDMQGRAIDTLLEGSFRENSILQIDINLEQQPAGIYLLQVKGAKTSFSRKIFKN